VFLFLAPLTIALIAAIFIMRAGEPGGSLRRALIFVLLGPLLGVVAIFAVLPILIGPIDLYGLPFVLFFSLIVSAIAGPVDGVLAYVVPVRLRVPLTAIVGAAVPAGVAVGLCLYVSIHLGKPMVAPKLYQLIPITLFGALHAGACSLLTHCFRRRKA